MGNNNKNKNGYNNQKNNEQEKTTTVVGNVPVTLGVDETTAEVPTDVNVTEQVAEENNDVVEVDDVALVSTLTQDVEIPVETNETAQEVVESQEHREVEEEVAPVTPVHVQAASPVTNGRYSVAALVNGSPLQYRKVVERLKQQGINYTDEANNTIIVSSHNTMADAIAKRKQLIGKGLKPFIL